MTRALADFLIAATASSSVSLPRARIATSAPDAANRVATARPMPLLPPVTMAERLCRLISMTISRAPPYPPAAAQGYGPSRSLRNGSTVLSRDDAVDRLAGRQAHR